MKNYLAKKLFSISLWPMIFLMIIWTVFLYGQSTMDHQAVYGVLPRTLEGVKGIFLSIFIHGGLDHIASNSLPLLILGMMLFSFTNELQKGCLYLDLVSEWFVVMDRRKK
ncbi:MAG: hypothetical protein IPG08_03140 [Sphingobacteriaceae bacterium]|nr:hypothetical protein [Sphingobacteriaceae bacterium]